VLRLLGALLLAVLGRCQPGHEQQYYDRQHAGQRPRPCGSDSSVNVHFFQFLSLPEEGIEADGGGRNLFIRHA
jgi:hypothetical protein